MPAKSDYRLGQVNKLKEIVKNSPHSNALLVGGSNDFKWFCVKDGGLCNLQQFGLQAWEALQADQKIEFSPKKHCILGKDGVNFIQEKVKEFGDILVDIYGGTNFENVFISSILERRLNQIPYLELYFCYINHFLMKLIAKMTQERKIFNVNLKPIKWHYINVSHQFFNAENPVTIFRGGDLTHRSLPAMEELCHIYMQKIGDTLAT